MRLYDYSGIYVNGFLNSVLSQRGCLQSTNGYNYLAMDDDVWVYTGVTSLNADQSNVGFVLMNQRTMATKYYEVEGAIEDSAMNSAEGQVQYLGYRAAFPLLLNVADEPTYFLALKDQAGLVKKYAMVNVQKYQLVAIGDTIKACEENYRALLLENGIISEEDVIVEEIQPIVPEVEVLTTSGIIAQIYNLIVDGDSSLYIALEDGEKDTHYYWINLTEGHNVVALNFQVVDTIAVSYEATEDGVRKVTFLDKK